MTHAGKGKEGIQVRIWTGTIAPQAMQCGLIGDREMAETISILGNTLQCVYSHANCSLHCCSVILRITLHHVHHVVPSTTANQIASTCTVNIAITPHRTEAPENLKMAVNVCT